FCRREGLPELEARRSCRENTCYRPNAHDSFSIGAVDAGSSVLTGPIDGTTRLEPGDVIVIPAGQAHHCNPDHVEARYPVFHVDHDFSTCRMPVRISSPLLDGFRVLRHPDLHSRVSALNDAIFTDGTLEAITSQFALLFTELEGAAPEHAAATESDPDLLIRLAPVLQRLRADLANPALTELAESIGMTKYQLIRAMRRATGLSPLAWRQNARIVRARHMLRQG